MEVGPKKWKDGAKRLHFFLHIRPLAQTTSGNTSKAVSQTRPSVVVGPTVPVKEKISFPKLLNKML